jgi:hypothetical protein
MRTNLPVTDKEYAMAEGVLRASKIAPKGVIVHCLSTSGRSSCGIAFEV